MPTLASILTTTPYAKDDIALASLVPDIRYPHQDAHKTDVLKSKDYTNNPDLDFAVRTSAERTSSFKATITRLFSIEAEREWSNGFDISAEKAFIYELRQPNQIFSKLCADDGVKRWLEDCYLQKRKPYLVVGYRTLLNAELVHRGQRSAKFSSEADLPIGTLSGTDPSPTGELDVKLAGAHGGKAESDGRMITSGERIYSVCYRRVRFKFHKGVGTSYPENLNIWKFFATTRGEATDENESVEAVLSPDDETAGTQIEIFETASGEERFFFLPTGEGDEEGDTSDGDEESDGE